MKAGQRARACACLVLVGAFGCGRTSEPKRVTARDSAGVRILEVGAVTEPGDTIQLQPRRFSARLPDFGDIRDVAIGPKGDVVVLDPMGPDVVVLDSTGAETAHFGGEGAGPGEFRRAGLTTVVVRGDTVAVPDVLEQRLTLFRIDGRVLSVVPLDVAKGLPVDWQASPDGGFVFRRVSSPQRLERLSLGGKPRSTEFRDLGPMSLPSASGPLTALPVWCLFADGRLALGRTDRYAIRVADGDRTTSIVESQAASRPLSDPDKQHLQALLTESISRRSGRKPDPALVKGLLERTPVPTDGPNIASLRCVGAGELWVQRALPVAEMGLDILRVGVTEGWGSTTWDVFDLRSEEQHTVQVPAGAQITRVENGIVVGFVADEYGRKEPMRWIRR